MIDFITKAKGGIEKSDRKVGFSPSGSNLAAPLLGHPLSSYCLAACQCLCLCCPTSTPVARVLSGSVRGEVSPFGGLCGTRHIADWVNPLLWFSKTLRFLYSYVKQEHG